MSVSQGGTVTTESGIKGVCWPTPVLTLGVGGAGHRLCHHRAANTLGNLVTQVPYRGPLAGKHRVAPCESGEMWMSLRNDWPGSAITNFPSHLESGQALAAHFF